MSRDYAEFSENVDRLKTAHIRLQRLVEPQVSRSVVAVSGGSRRRLAERAPANIEAIDLAYEIATTVDDLLRRASRLGAGVDPGEKVPQLLPVPEAARRLGVDRSRVWQLIREGKLEEFRHRGRAVVLDVDVDDLLHVRRNGSGDRGRGGAVRNGADVKRRGPAA